MRFVALALLTFATARAGEIVSVYPTGSVKEVQQVVVKFTTDMVSLGDPRSKKDPMKLTCHEGEDKAVTAPKYTTHWADTKTWSLDFDKPLEAGVQCSLQPIAQLKDLKGADVTTQNKYSFSTSGPALLGIAPRYGDIEPDQYFAILLDGEVQPKSVESLAYFEAEGIPDKIATKVISGPARETVIKAAIKDNWDWNAYRKLAEMKNPPANAFANFLVVAGTRRFPEARNVTLHWPKGILSKSGVPVEEEQSFDFKVVAPFQVRFNCDRVSKDRACNPVLDMSLNFTSRLPLAQLVGTKIVAANGQEWVPVELQKGDQNKNLNGVLSTGHKSAVGLAVISNFADQQVDSLTFRGPFPEKTKFTVQLAKGLKDGLGRKLINENKFPLETETDEFSPLLKFAAPFGVLELNADPALPVSLRNLEPQVAGKQISYDGKTFTLTAKSTPKQVIDMYHAVNKKSYDDEHRNQPMLPANEGTAISVPKPLGSREFESVGIPMKDPGLHVIELASPKLGAALVGQNQTMYVASAALVTNLAVHFKKGRESSAVWVTALDTSKPLKDVDVGLFDDNGNELTRGKTDASGLWRVGRVHFPCQAAEEGEDEGERSSCETYAFAKLGNDFSFTSTTWHKGIESYRFNLMHEYLAPTWGPVTAHTILDRAVAEAGETINMKHLLREHTGQGFRALNPKHIPRNVLIIHDGSRKTYTFPFTYDKTTSAGLTTFHIPKDASLGLYTVYLSNRTEAPKNSDPNEESFDYAALGTASFVVSEYRLPLMEATVKIQGQPLLQPKDVNVDLSANYLSGGPAKGMKAKLRASFEFANFNPDVPGAHDFQFFSDPVKVGTFDNSRGRGEDDPSVFVSTQDVTLDANGGLKAKIPNLPPSKTQRDLVVEMEYRDPNGEIKTASSRAAIFPAGFIVGLKSENYYSNGGKAAVSGVIVDIKGAPAPSRAYTVEAFHREEITHRKRLVGGFYSYDSKTKITSLGEVCSGKTDKYGRFTCNAKGLTPGELTMQAKASDEKGRATYASTNLTVYGDDANMWWAASDSDRIDVIPEKTRYEPGETAKFAVRSPFPQSMVLVTIEREGVLDAFVKQITRDESTIDVPIKASYAPNVFVSMLAVRGRVGEPQPTALVDLSKPAMKLGETEIQVGWKGHELKVAVSTDKKKYMVREKATAKIHVVRADGKPLEPGAEVAVVAVDEALERLRSNFSLDVLTAMMGQRGLAVETSTSQIEVIGKRHFGAKAKPSGGGGGRGAGEDARQLFDPMLLWNGVVKLDAKGDASVTVPLNDSITSFKITAVATSGMDHFGSGSNSIRATKDLIIYSGFAPLVRDGDVISDRFTVRNTTAKPMNLNVSVTSAQIKNVPAVPAFTLDAGESKTLEVPVTVPAGVRDAVFDIAAKDSVSGASDAMKAKVNVDFAVPDHVMMATLFQLDKSASVPVRQPADAIPDRGGLEIKAQGTLVKGLATVKAYMTDYPYTCLEQKLSKAVVLEDRDAQTTIANQLPTYQDSAGLFKFFPSSECGSPQLTRYVLTMMKANGVDIPKGALNRSLDGLDSWMAGHGQCHTWWDSIVRDNYRDQERVLIMDALSQYKRFKLDHITTIQRTPNLWANEALAAWYRLLQREPGIPKRDELMKQALNILHARVNYQGSLMTLQKVPDWEAQWMLFTSPDEEATSVFGIVMDDPQWKDNAGKMARGLLARMNKGIWDTTTANAWAVVNLRHFSSVFEKDKVTGTTAVTAPGVSQTFSWPTGGDALLPWPQESTAKLVPLAFKQNGGGKPWMMVQTRSAIPLRASMDLGYKIARKLIPISQKTPGKFSDGDVVNVELTVTAKTDQPWVVVRDPVPAGASHLGNGLEGSSAILDKTPKSSGAGVDQWPTEFEEKSNAYFTSYAAYLAKGTYRLNYRIRLNSSGTFRLPPSHVEAMYSPEVFGDAPNGPWIVLP